MKTKTLTKILLILLIITSLSSCGDKIPTRNVIKEPYIVKSINEWNNNYCVYTVNNGINYVNFIREFYVVDSIGKYNIGDKIVFTTSKY